MICYYLQLFINKIYSIAGSENPPKTIATKNDEVLSFSKFERLNIWGRNNSNLLELTIPKGPGNLKPALQSSIGTYRTTSLLNASTFLWKDSFVFSCYNNGL
eukprot:TRINITY_DN2905_c0_g1_i1.p1 TRINITY_DN2905_c0_g1~~TRINITY_DN2905_c0_g1_i1.p1  ORF type:complete len:102 (+),score=2.96 TRINITY_DN2905_c0_g1_i1:709-1014(+)